jgi:predicted PolB exonuclease-like 3'-5' exonuclease
MPEQTVIVWDLETVPDLAAAARLLDLGAATETEVREALGPGFPKHPLHKIACIGALVASRQPEGWRVDALGAPHSGERSECRLIRDFIEKIGQLRPQLITFNGHSFDLPVNRIPAAYTEDALDLCDVLGREGVASGHRRRARGGDGARRSDRGGRALVRDRRGEHVSRLARV